LTRVVVSLDFELRWGMTDVFGRDMSAYRSNLLGVREIVPALIERFEKRGIHATWATVAALACENWDEYQAAAPKAPHYLETSLAIPSDLRTLDASGDLHFAPELVSLIAHSKQELASHSFSHFFFGEPGAMEKDARDDAKAVSDFFQKKFKKRPTSLVFPRNQVAFGEIFAEHGLRTQRSNPQNAIWDLPVELREWKPARLMRFAESFVGVTPARRAGIYFPASSFVRLQLPEPLFRLHRLALARAARALRSHEYLHLWFHPHNLGDAPTMRMDRLESIFDAIGDAVSGAVEFFPMAAVA
jgi:hypothetical protein